MTNLHAARLARGSRMQYSSATLPIFYQRPDAVWRMPSCRPLPPLRWWCYFTSHSSTRITTLASLPHRWTVPRTRVPKKRLDHHARHCGVMHAFLQSCRKPHIQGPLWPFDAGTIASKEQHPCSSRWPPSSASRRFNADADNAQRPLPM
jgi:hypothetical protein